MSNEFINTLENSFIISSSQKQQYVEINKKLNYINCKIGTIDCIIKKQNSSRNVSRITKKISAI